MPVQLLRFLSLLIIRDGQLYVIYSRWHRPRLGSNAAMGFVKTIDGRMRFGTLLVIDDNSELHIEAIIEVVSPVPIASTWSHHQHHHYDQHYSA